MEAPVHPKGFCTGDWGGRDVGVLSWGCALGGSSVPPLTRGLDVLKTISHVKMQQLGRL